VSNRRLIVGNWKMHKTAAEAAALVRRLAALAPRNPGADVVLAPPFTALHLAFQPAWRRFALAAQNMHWEDEGRFTGEVSAPMLIALGCRYVILGHSERREHFGETDANINRKLLAALRHGLRPILCVGESWRERRRGLTAHVVTRQLLRGLAGVPKQAGRAVTIAYEPIWAIGKNRPASPAQTTDAHATLRAVLARKWGRATAGRVRILYGGSVTADNVAGFLASPEVDGVLVGGACLDPKSFARIIAAARSPRE
jgi:triosephosphate isomerase